MTLSIYRSMPVRPLGSSGIAPGSGGGNRAAGVQSLAMATGNISGVLPKVTAQSLAGALDRKFGAAGYEFAPQPDREENSIYVSMCEKRRGDIVMIGVRNPKGVFLYGYTSRGGLGPILAAEDFLGQLLGSADEEFCGINRRREWPNAGADDLARALRLELEAYWEHLSRFDNTCPEACSPEEREIFFGLQKYLSSQGKGYSFRAGIYFEEFPRLADFANDFAMTVRCDTGGVSYAVVVFTGDKATVFAKGINAFFLEQEIERLSDFSESRKKLIEGLRPKLREITKKEEMVKTAQKISDRLVGFFSGHKPAASAEEWDNRYKCDFYVGFLCRRLKWVKFYFLTGKLFVNSNQSDKELAGLKQELRRLRGKGIRVTSVFRDGKKIDGVEQWDIGYEELLRVLPAPVEIVAYEIITCA